MHYELPSLKEHTASTSAIIQAIRSRDYAFNGRDALLDELERRSKAGVRERLARVEQDLAELRQAHVIHRHDIVSPTSTKRGVAYNAEPEAHDADGYLSARRKVAGPPINHREVDYLRQAWCVVVAQLDVAGPAILDGWGEVLGLPREHSEADAIYRGRLLGEAKRRYAVARAPVGCNHSQILRESGKCAACGREYLYAEWCDGQLKAIRPKW